MVNTNNHPTTLRCVCSVSFSSTVTSCGVAASSLLAVWEIFCRPCRPRRSFGTEQGIALSLSSFQNSAILTHAWHSVIPLRRKLRRVSANIPNWYFQLHPNIYSAQPWVLGQHNETEVVQHSDPIARTRSIAGQTADIKCSRLLLNCRK